MAKRIATSELNHDNWNEEEAPEEAGTFRKASPDVIQNRVIKSAKRRSVGVTESESDGKKNAFLGFDGFKTNTDQTSSSFNFLTNFNSGAALQTLNGSKGNKAMIGMSPVEPTSTVTNTQISKSSEYYSKLKGLNESVSQWIKSHVDSNPFCILTPVFLDYERYLGEIESDRITPNPSKDVAGVSNDEKAQSSDILKPFNFITNKIAIQSKGATPMALGSSVFSSSKQSSSSESPIAAKSEATVVSSTSKQTTKDNLESSGSDSKMELNPFMASLGNKTQSFLISNKGSSPLSSSGFSFGSGKLFTFSNVSKQDVSSEESKEVDEDQPPKAEFTPVIEEGTVYSKRCKVFVKKDTSYQDRGVGVLYLKPVSSGEKTQLIVRADTSLGNLLVNTLLTSSLSLQKMGNNNVMLICIPTPETKQPTPILFRVKTASDADELLNKLKEYQK